MSTNKKSPLVRLQHLQAKCLMTQIHQRQLVPLLLLHCRKLHPVSKQVLRWNLLPLWCYKVASTAKIQRRWLLVS